MTHRSASFVANSVLVAFGLSPQVPCFDDEANSKVESIGPPIRGESNGLIKHVGICGEWAKPPNLDLEELVGTNKL